MENKMKKIKSILCFAAIASLLAFTACNEWLDVKPDTQMEEDDMFVSYHGFRDALTGCYMQMGSNSIYGQHMTMDWVESLAEQWYVTAAADHPYDYYFMEHDYTDENCRSGIQSMFDALFNTVAQANMVLKHIGEEGDVIKDAATRSVIEGEAYAIRAYCLFDALRLFGRMPSGGTDVRLPYPDKVSILENPSYYGFDQYAAKVEADLKKASELLKDNDPIFKYDFYNNIPGTSTAADITDDFMAYRRFRLNYWAVQALLARFYLYIGNTSAAYSAAKSVIDAKDSAGEPVITLSGSSDLLGTTTVEGYYACPKECLFAISKYDLLDYSDALLGGGVTGTGANNKLLRLNRTMMDALFAGRNTASNNHYLYLWNSGATDVYGVKYFTLKKYYYNDATSGNSTTKMLYRNLVPMLRLSEMYLIAMETTADLAEANSLYVDYMRAEDELVTSDRFASLPDVQSAMPHEYQFKFFGEGQVFFTHKRLATPTISHNAINQYSMGEAQYVLPLPDTEFE